RCSPVSCGASASCATGRRSRRWRSPAGTAASCSGCRSELTFGPLRAGISFPGCSRACVVPSTVRGVMRRLSRLAVVLALGLFATSAGAVDGTWSRLPVLRGISLAASALDESRHCVWVYGGATNGSLDATNSLFRYALDAGGTWELIPTAGDAPK